MVGGIAHGRSHGVYGANLSVFGCVAGAGVLRGGVLRRLRPAVGWFVRESGSSKGDVWQTRGVRW